MHTHNLTKHLSTSCRIDPEGLRRDRLLNLVPRLHRSHLLQPLVMVQHTIKRPRLDHHNIRLLVDVILQCSTRLSFLCHFLTSTKCKIAQTKCKVTQTDFWLLAFDWNEFCKIEQSGKLNINRPGNRFDEVPGAAAAANSHCKPNQVVQHNWK